MKAQICQICAAVCQKMGFRRKNAFYLRLSVLFRLNVASESVVSDSKDYQVIYPILYRSLRGYGIKEGSNFANDATTVDDHHHPNHYGSAATFAPTPEPIVAHRRSPYAAGHRNKPFAIQVKAVYEVFISASRACLYDVAIRHLCYILQNYFNNMSTDDILEKIGELAKLVSLHKDVHSLAQPISLYEHGIILPPVQFARFPTLSNFKVCALPPHLAPNVVDPADLASKIFIYSPFQDKKKQQAAYWVVDCACEVAVSVRNPLPIELMVKNLTLLTAGGCKFEAIPVRLNLPSCFGSDASAAAASIKLLGVPRSAGTLTLAGYSCEVLGVKSVCSLTGNNPNNDNYGNNDNIYSNSSRSHSTASHNNNNSSSQQQQQQKFTVRVLESLPLLAIETSLKMTPTVDNSVGSIAEATVFSGQMLNYSIFLHNTSTQIAIKSVSIKIQQPEVCGGPKLVEVLHSLEVADIEPGERREVKIRIFGIDPSANTPANEPPHYGSAAPIPPPPAAAASATNFVGEEHRVYVRRHTSLSIAPSENSSDSPSIFSKKEQYNSNSSGGNSSGGGGGGGGSGGGSNSTSWHSSKKRWSNPLMSKTSALSTATTTSTATASAALQQLSPSKLLKTSSSSSSFLSPNSADKHSHSAAAGEDNSHSRSTTTVNGSSGSGTTVAETEETTAGHDLIPYIGRLLSAEFIFTYTADILGPGDERYERVAKLPLAIAIVPAVNVLDWHILTGDGPTTRYVVVDVTNHADVDAELTHGDGRLIWLQPKEVCRVPLLCPCCAEVESRAFALATRQPSHMMQMREVERLRRTLEKHVAKYLDIRWSIPTLNLEGFVPVGSLLSSVSFLKQLVIPEVSVSIQINEASYVSEDDVMVGIGEIVKLKIILLLSAKREKPFRGMLSLSCYQYLQNAQLHKINQSENLIVYGPTRLPICIKAAAAGPQPTTAPQLATRDSGGSSVGVADNSDKMPKPQPIFRNNNTSSSNNIVDGAAATAAAAADSAIGEMGRFEAVFSLSFRCEGIHKIHPELSNLSSSAEFAATDAATLGSASAAAAAAAAAPALADEDIFVPFASFNVTTKT